MDNTNDPAYIGDRVAQSLVNLFADRSGVLRGAVSLDNFSLNAFTGPIDGVGWLNSAPVTYSGPTSPTTPLAPRLAVVAGGTLYVYPVVTPLTYPPTFNVGGVSTQTGVLTGHRMRFAAFEDELYGVQEANDFFNYRIQNGGTISQMGMGANGTPTIVLSGGTQVKTGTRSYVTTNVDNQGRESSPNTTPGVQAYSGTTDKGTVSVTALDEQAAFINFYVQPDGSQTYYLFATDAVTTVPAVYTAVDDLSDAQVTALTQTAPHFGENDPPPPSYLIAVHKNRVVVAVTAQAGVIAISNYGSATQFNSTGIQVDPAGGVLYPDDGLTLAIGTDQGDVITGLDSFGSLLWIGKRNGTYLLWGDDQTDFNVRKCSEIGCIAPDSVANANSFMFYLSNDGVYMMDGSLLPEKISKPIESVFLALMATPAGLAKMQAAQGWYVDKRYHLSLDGVIYVYDMDAKGWTTLSLGITITSAVVVEQKGITSFAIVGRSDANLVSMIDEVTTGVSVANMQYRTRLLSSDNIPYKLRSEIGSQETRTGRKMLYRVRVTGEGTVSSGSIVATVDGRTQTFNAPFYTGDEPSGYLIVQEFLPNMIGYSIDLTLNITGTGIFLRDIEADYILVG